MANLELRYRKTVAGADELLSKRLGLSREQRNLLIIADGRHALSVYCQAVGCDPEKLGSLADQLLGFGLLETLGSSSNTQMPAATAPEKTVVAAPGPGGQDASAIPPPVTSPEKSPESLKQRLCELAVATFGAQVAQPVIARLDKGKGSVGELVVAIESAGKLAKLTIDEEKAEDFLSEARRMLGI